MGTFVTCYWATDMVINESLSVQQAARDFELCHVMLFRYIKKTKSHESLKMSYDPHTRI